MTISPQFANRLSAKQRTPGIVDPNSRGNTVYVSRRLRFTVESWSSYVPVGFIVVNDLNGIQAAPSGV